MQQPSAATRAAASPVDYDEADRAAFFRIFQDAFGDAARNVGGAADFDYLVAGQKIRLRFAGDALARSLNRALAHLRIEAPGDTPPDLTVCLWDTASTGRKLPHLLDAFLKNLYCQPVFRIQRGRRGEIFALNSRRFRASLNGPYIFTFLDAAQKTAIYWMPDNRELPDYEKGAPLKTIFHWWFSTPARQLVHGGAIGNAAGGVLLAGEGGSGKSTTALNCLDSPLLYASDDYVLVELEPQPVAHSLFNTAKVKTRKDLARFPRLAAWLTNPEGVASHDEKPMMFVSENAPEKLITALPLKAVLCPRFVAGEKLRLAEINAAAAFQAVAASTVRQTPNADGETLRMLRRLIEILPNYELVFGEEQSEIPDVIQNVLLKHS